MHLATKRTLVQTQGALMPWYVHPITTRHTKSVVHEDLDSLKYHFINLGYKYRDERLGEERNRVILLFCVFIVNSHMI
jgi:hypothetical protein